MSDYMKSNPSDTDGATQRQETVIGIVIDNKDPEETGRVRVRILGEQDDQSVSDDQLPWYPVLSNGFPQTGGVGRFPAGGMYLPGTRIVLRNVGQQGFLVEGSIPNSQTEKGKQDRHPASTSTSTVEVRSGSGKTHQIVLDGSKLLNELEKTTDSVMSYVNGEKSKVWKRVNDKVKKIVEEAATSIQFNERPSARIKQGQKPMPISVKPWDFSINAQEFVKQIPNAELIQNSVSMLENLKKTAQQSLNPQQIMSLGGIGNIMGALQSILGFINLFKPKKKDDKKTKEEEVIEEVLKELDELSRDPDTPTS